MAEAKLTVTWGWSLSVMDIVVSSVEPAVTPVGRELPKPSLTFSPSSSIASSVAEKVSVFSVSLAPKFRVVGAPKKSVDPTPSRYVAFTRISTDLSGLADRITLTVTLLPSGTL